MKIVLASSSPRRRQLLSQIGWEFEVIVSKVEENVTSTDPRETVEALSRQKAEAVLASMPQADEDLLVIGADTVVACDGRILGKPQDEKEAGEMLGMLQGGSHYVYTGVTLCLHTGGGQTGLKELMIHTFCESTLVRFFPMSKQETEWYAASGEPLDKAGGYGIQGLCARYIRGIEGDYNNVVGLPVGRLYQEVKKLCKERVQ